MHSINPMVRKPIQNEIYTTLQRSVHEIHEIWQASHFQPCQLMCPLLSRGYREVDLYAPMGTQNTTGFILHHPYPAQVQCLWSYISGDWEAVTMAHIYDSLYICKIIHESGPSGPFGSVYLMYCFPTHISIVKTVLPLHKSVYISISACFQLAPFMLEQIVNDFHFFS